MYTVLNRTCWAIVLFIKSFDKGQKKKRKTPDEDKEEVAKQNI